MLSLSIDVGNSRIKIGLFKGKSLLKTYAVPKGEFEIPIELAEFDPKEAMISSVLHIKETKKLLANLNLQTYYLNPETSLPFINSYASPKTLGMDRLAAVAGAYSLFPENDLLVIDAGTCITYDFLSRSEGYMGGAISPGIQMRLQAMNKYTATLPLVPWNSALKTELVGTSTETAILSGAVNGCSAEIEESIKRYKRAHPGIKIFLTGGDSAFFEKKLKNTIFADLNLVLKGLNEILFYNRENS